VKLRTLAIILAAGLWIPGYLHYGWLLLQTVTSAPDLWIGMMFSVQFVLWLFPSVGLAVLLIIEKFGTSARQSHAREYVTDLHNKKLFRKRK